MNYAQHFNPRETPQSEQADPRQVKNSAGGYTFQIDCWKRLERFLILGCEGGTYYATEQTLTRENAKTVAECLDADGKRTVKTIVDVSDGGRAPKNDAAIFALALAASALDESTRRDALAALPKVCRIGTHLFAFAEAIDKFRGWGPSLRKAVGRWYSEKSIERLCEQLAKYEQRNGWSHRDLLRLAHPEPKADRAAIYRWATARDLGERSVAGSEKAKRAERKYGAVEGLPAYLAAFDELKHADQKRTIELVREHGFTHEMIDTRHKNSPEVWEALFERMPMTAMIRNLAKMTAVGFLKPLSSSIPVACSRLTDTEALRKARVHPIAVLSALAVYRQGHGEKGSLTWSPVSQIMDALDAGFYASFGALQPSGKRMLLAIDVSGSMDSNPVSGVPGLDCRQAAAAMAMVTARTEPTWHAVGFASNGRGCYGGRWGGNSPVLVDIGITPRMRLDDVIAKMRAVPMGGTDCALPMLHAAGNELGVDCFVVYTDNETWAGQIHPHQALEAYRAKSGIDARLAVSAFTATNFSIAKQDDPRELDIVGFDLNAPAVLAEFARG